MRQKVRLGRPRPQAKLAQHSETDFSKHPLPRRVGRSPGNAGEGGRKTLVIEHLYKKGIPGSTMDVLSVLATFRTLAETQSIGEQPRLY